MAEVGKKIVKVFYPDEDRRQCAYCEADNNGFNSFIQNIYEVVRKDYLNDSSRFVEGPDQIYCIFWIDEDNDKIMISNDKSFSIFMKRSGARKIYIEEKNAATITPGTMPASSAAAGLTTHTGVQCNGCDTLPIKGFRYKCAQCDDFDLCMHCEQKKIHGDHVMYRIPVALPKGLIKIHRKLAHFDLGKHHEPLHHLAKHHGPDHHLAKHHEPLHHLAKHHGPFHPLAKHHGPLHHLAKHHGPDHYHPGHHHPEHNCPGSPKGRHSHRGMHHLKDPHHKKHRLGKKMPHSFFGRPLEHSRRVHHFRDSCERELTDFDIMIDLTESGEPESSVEECPMETDRTEPSVPEPERATENTTLQSTA